MQAKRIGILESNLGVGGQVAISITVPTEPREEVNFHNIHASVSVEPQDTDANCQGTWVLELLPENMPGNTYTDGTVNAETANAVIIAIGVFSASNQTPFNSGDINPKTSRNAKAGDLLRMVATVTGITAGLASTRVLLFANTTRK